MYQKKLLPFIATLVVVQVFFFAALSPGQGNLTPPGAPAPTMKTTQEIYDETTAAKSSADTAAAQVSDAVDPRTPIRASDLPLNITSPGSYYLSEAITVTTTDTHGITIDCDNVTIDLNGFTLSGSATSGSMSMSGSAPSLLPYGSGIYVVSSSDPLIEHYNIAVKNGVLTRWWNGAVGGAGNNTFESLACHANLAHGLWAGSNSIVKNNTCMNNGGSGIVAGDNCVLRGNTSNTNGSNGITAGNYCSIEENVCNGNTGNGISASSGKLTDNTCCMNTICGIVASYSSLISGNTCFYNSDDGIQTGNSCLVVDNACSANGQGVSDGAGIQASQEFNCIESNLVTGNDKGVDCSQSMGNCITGNRARGNSTDYDILTGNTVFTGDRENITF